MKKINENEINEKNKKQTNKKTYSNLSKTCYLSNSRCTSEGSKGNVYKQMIHKQNNHTGIQHLISECAAVWTPSEKGSKAKQHCQ